MHEDKNISILLISEYNPRSEILSQRISEVFDSKLNLKVVQDIKDVINLGSFEPDFIFLDLANIKSPAMSTVQIISESFNHSKIIASHIYHSRVLIDPLFEYGVDGYLTYEPSVKQISNAVGKVASGGKFLPERIRNR